MTLAANTVAAPDLAAKASASKSVQSLIDRRVAQQVRRDLLIFSGFIAAGFILSVNLDVVGLL